MSFIILICRQQSETKEYTQATRKQSYVPQPTQTLSQIYTVPSGGCVSEDSILLVNAQDTSGDDKSLSMTASDLAKLLKTKSARVYTRDGLKEIERAVEKPYTGNMIQLNTDISITPWHPIMKMTQECAFQWKFANELEGKVKHVENVMVYSFLMAVNTDMKKEGRRSPTIFVGGHYIATLGHGYVDPVSHPVIGHPYWGRDVLNDLQDEKNICCIF